MQDQLKTVSQSIDFIGLRHKNAYLMLSECFYYIFSNLNEFVASQISPFLTNTIEFRYLGTFREIFTNSELEPKIYWPL